MLNPFVVAAACFAWLAVMFGLARWAQRNPPAFARHWWLVYGLSLAIHCTSWTFFGTVSQAARSGWWIPPTFVGAVLMYTVGFGFIRRMVRIGRETHASSIADLVAARLGKSAPLAATVTLVMAIGMVPYIALQLRAVTNSFSMLMQGGIGSGVPVWFGDIALYCALAMAAFAVLFGARDANASAHNRGLVLAIAFESVFKLAAMLAVGAFVIWKMPSIPSTREMIPEPDTVGFMPLIMLGAMAMFIQPHQFHMAAVENRSDADTVRSRWMLPVYLLVIALPVLPIALIGKQVFQDQAMTPDLYVLALPLHAGNGTVALTAFLGGLSAATGMVIVSVLTLSLMVVNHWLSPALLRRRWLDSEQGDLRQYVLVYRRIAIFLIMLLAWGFGRVVDSNAALADVGAFSFSAMVPVVPALWFALWRPQQVSSVAVTYGVLAGLAVWVWVMLLPLTTWDPSFPSLVHWLEPRAWLGLDSWSTLGKGVISSLVVSYVVTLMLASRVASQQRRGAGGLQVSTLRVVAARFLTPQRVAELFQGKSATDLVSPQLGEQVESELSKVLGSSSAHLLLDAAHNREGLAVDQVARIVDETRVGLQFNQQILEAALKNMSQGISVVDRDLRLVAWNPRYAQLFGFPAEKLIVGTPIRELTLMAMRDSHPHLSATQREAAADRRLAYMRAGTTHLTERVLPDGSIIEIRGTPMPDGGFVATFSDVTAFRQAQHALTQANENLESRVLERTQLLQVAKKEAELANEAKTRFMTAVGHDLMQPLHAAHLFADGLESYLHRQTQIGAEPLRRVSEIRGALERTTDLLQSLMDMAKLKSGGMKPALRVMPSRDITDPLATEFAAIALAKGLAFAYEPCEEWITTDAVLLRRILQNFLSNATRYATQGTVSLICSVQDDRLRLAVLDEGPGLDADARGWIFEEFRRGSNAGDSGLGLGLSIARGLSDLLQVELGIDSQPGHGSTFYVDVLAAAHPAASELTPVTASSHRDILLVDNEPQIRNVLEQMISAWSHHVSAHDGNDIDAIAADAAHSQVWLFDYHLDQGRTGVELYRALIARLQARPTLILTADISDTVRAQCQEHDLILVSKPIKPLALKSVLQRLISASAFSR